MTVDDLPSYDVCPVCEKPFVKSIHSKFGGSIDHTKQLRQNRTCFWPTADANGSLVAVFYHIDDGETREGTIDLTTGDD